ncbi:FAD-dependent oxidoreductase [Streptomyces caeni]|uniref:FAD-dependent oxidoreductase n=1 Tax=Streptomyces caeni TaxID=2307231 RepID=A0ABW4IJG6_9ACTN
MGGGVVACEAAAWLHGLGAEVTVVHRGEQLPARNEPFAGELVGEGLRESGVRLRLGRRLSRVQRPDARGTGQGRVHKGEVRVTSTTAPSSWPTGWSRRHGGPGSATTVPSVFSTATRPGVKGVRWSGAPNDRADAARRTCVTSSQASLRQEDGSTRHAHARSRGQRDEPRAPPAAGAPTREPGSGPQPPESCSGTMSIAPQGHSAAHSPHPLQ